MTTYVDSASLGKHRSSINLTCVNRSSLCRHALHAQATALSRKLPKQKKSKKRNFTKCPKHRSRHFSTRLHDHSLRLRSKLGKLVDEFGLNDAFSVPADCSDVRVPVKSDVTRYCNTFNKCLLVSSVSLLAQQTDLQIYNPKTGTKSNTRADKTVKQRRRLATMAQATNCAVCAARTAMIT